MNRFIRILSAAVAAVIVVAAAGAPALAQGMTDDSACVKDLLSGEEFGLCNAYCEAMDCDGDTPQASNMACEKVKSKFEAITTDPIPCLAEPPSNTAPVVDLNGVPDDDIFDTTATFVSFGDAVPIAVDVVITDDDGDVIVSATVTLTNSPDGLNETLSLTPAGDLLVTNDLVGGDWGFDSSSGVLTITGTGDKATYADILLEVVYDNALGDPDTTARIVDVFVSDETDPSLTAATSVLAVEVGCPCPSFSSDMIINTALRAYRPLSPHCPDDLVIWRQSTRILL